NVIIKSEFFAVAFGIFALYVSFASDGEVDCGGKIMSLDQQCITTRFHGVSSYGSSTRNYVEPRDQDHRQRVFIGVIGSISLLVGAGQIIGRSRQKNEKKSDQEHIRNETLAEAMIIDIQQARRKTMLLRQKLRNSFLTERTPPRGSSASSSSIRDPHRLPKKLTGSSVYSRTASISTRTGVYISLPTT